MLFSGEKNNSVYFEKSAAHIDTTYIKWP